MNTRVKNSALVALCIGFIQLAFMQQVMAAPATNTHQSYKLAAGDEISIRVFGEPDMDVKTRLGDEGAINYPLLGEITVRGLTASELEQVITRGLKGPYLVDPVVSVDITEYRPFFVNGDVARPGAIPYQPGVTLRKAIAMAGGFTERASRDSADVISSGDQARKPRTATMDEFIQPGDIITVRPSFF